MRAATLLTSARSTSARSTSARPVPARSASAPLTAGLLASVLLLAGCGADPAVGEQDLRQQQAGQGRVERREREAAGSVDVPELAGTWQALPAAPLLPRGGTQAVWTGSQVILWGGQAVDPTAQPCPDGASCIAPPPGPEAQQAAAYEPATGTWRTLTGTPPGYGYPLWAQGKVLDQSSAYDPATGTSTAHASHELLVYARAQVIGSQLVVVGWDHARGELGGVGQVAAASLELADLGDPQARWRSVEWPLPPPGAESIKTATAGEDLLVLVWAWNPAICGAGGQCHRLLRFDPAAGTWRDLGVYEQRVQQLASGGGRIYATAALQPPGGPLEGSSSQVLEVDPVDGSVTSLGDPGSYGDLLVSERGRVAVVAGSDIRVRTQDGQWRRLPAVPGNPVHPAVVWAGEDLLVWGGAATEGDRGSRNSADGWIIHPVP